VKLIAIAASAALALGAGVLIGGAAGTPQAEAQNAASGFTLSVQQLVINQRISSAAVRRSNQALTRLDALEPRVTALEARVGTTPAAAVAGQPGAQGEQGVQGPQGPKGDQGDPGPQGPAGQGVNSFRFGTNECYPINGSGSFDCYDTSVLPSSNATNKANGWAHFEASTTDGVTTLTFNGTRAFVSCFEYRINGSLPTDPRPNFNTALEDGLWDYRCVNSSSTPTSEVVIEDADLIEVRLSFGAEADERYTWEVVPQ
jgi:hypothetical protein